MGHPPEGRLISVDNGTTASYLYDAEGHRAGTTVGSTSREFIFDLSNHLAGMMQTTGGRSWNREEIYAGSWHLASYVSGALQFNHADWLGTVRVRTNTSGSVINSYTNLPFGDCLDQNNGSNCDGLVGGSPAHFTDQDRDTETGLDHFLFRQYSAVQGRWMRPDPAGTAATDAGNPQTWNQYTYVANNPVNATDPLGLELVLVFIDAGGGGGAGDTYWVDANDLVAQGLATRDANGNAVAVTDFNGSVNLTDGSGKTVATIGGGTDFGIAYSTPNYSVTVDGSKDNVLPSAGDPAPADTFLQYSLGHESYSDGRPESAHQAARAIANAFKPFPTICSVGGFLYFGPLYGEYDSQSGLQAGLILEGQLKKGNDAVKGGGAVTWDSNGNRTISGPMIFAGPPVGPGVFVQLPLPGADQGTPIGGYYGVSKWTGAGAYGTVTSLGGCWKQGG